MLRTYPKWLEHFPGPYTSRSYIPRAALYTKKIISTYIGLNEWNKSMFLYVLRARSTQHIFSYESVLKVEVVYMNIKQNIPISDCTALGALGPMLAR
jgi:hypothetical protein